MKAIIIIFAVLSMGMTSPDVSGYCDGFEVGYETGWCYERYGCVSPVTPVCPVPAPGFESWRDGYNRGFAQALRDRN